MVTKICSTCKATKTKDQFTPKKSSKDGLASACKSCKNIKTRELYYKRKLLVKEYPALKTCCTCKEEKPTELFSKYSASKDGYMKRCKSCTHQHYKDNFDSISEKGKIYVKNNRKSINKYKLKWVLNKTESNPLFRRQTLFSSALTSALKCKKEDKIIKGLDYTIGTLKEHIEKLFTTEMSWDNYGSHNLGNNWDIDHIVPHSYAKSEDELLLLNHWSNLQPLNSSINRNVKRGNLYPLSNLELSITFNPKDNETGY